MSSWLHDHLAPGDRLRVRGPLGEFSVVEHPATSYLLMSAGSGITPTLSTLRAVADLAEQVDLVVVHHARTPVDLIDRAEVDAVVAGQPGVRVVWVCESDAPDATWDGHRGRVSAEVLRAEVPDLTEREVFLCGPPGYLAAARDALDALGADPARRHEERFVIDGPRRRPRTPPHRRRSRGWVPPSASPAATARSTAPGHHGAGRGRGRGCPAADRLRPGPVRHLQVDPAHRRRRHAPRRRDPAPGGGGGALPALLLDPDRRHRRRRVSLPPEIRPHVNPGKDR